MTDPQQASQTQLANIVQRTGKSIDEFAALLRASGLEKHGELRDYLKAELALGHGDANAMVHHVLAFAAPPDTATDPLAVMYAGPKAALRPIHQALMLAIEPLGPFELAPKKGYVSLRRKKQLAMIRPATNSCVERRLNMKGLPATERLLELPPGGMCNVKVRLSTASEVDAQVIAWVRAAFDAAGPT